MAFTKNPLTDGTKKKLSVYSQDLENRIGNEFDLLDLLSLKNNGIATSFDSATETGLYRSEIQNYLGTMVVFKRSNNDITQLIFHWNSYAIYMRSKWNGTWSDVRQVSLT